ncbi:MAG TPA: hypothetical protein VG963_26785, partial [Polyangiaceae bacterium]|nr:hypothetical protein [Polyangiaceae bacterium]
MSRVYGDSTPFPYDIDYIELLRAGVDCAVRLLSAHHAMRAARERVDQSASAQAQSLAELGQLFDGVQAAAGNSITQGSDLTVRTAAQIVASARSVVAAATADLEGQVAAERNQARQIADKARESGLSAIEHLLERHSPPGSRCDLQITAGLESNAGQVTVVTPYGVTASFGIALPPNHVWARPRRVVDLVPQLEIQMPKESGWLSKRVEMTPLRLDRFFVSEFWYGESSGELSLRRGASSGPGYRLQVEMGATGTVVSIRPLRDDGTPVEAQPLVLEGKDLGSMLAVWQSALDSSSDLLSQRRRLIAATFLEAPFGELESPRPIAEAIINDMAPLVVEISRRSGARAELVLRRNLGEGRREETYSTHAELLDKIRILPPDLRIVFAPLHLDDTAAPFIPEPPLSPPPGSPRVSGIPAVPPPPLSRPPIVAQAQP